MNLFFREYGQEGHQPLVILHGLFGMSDNWVSIARRISEDGFHVFVPDQRNHGRSGHSNIHNYESMVDDLLEFLDERGFEKISLLGHSMGGKTVMQFAFDYPERVDKLIVADISPLPSSHGEMHKKIIGKLLDLDLKQFKSRQDALWAMGSIIANDRLRMFLQKNLYWKDRASLGWRVNLEAIRDNMPEVFRGLESVQPYEKPVLFLRGGESDYVKDEHISVIRSFFPQASVRTIEGASHWLHAEKPDAFVKEVLFFLSE
jgi:esterase